MSAPQQDTPPHDAHAIAVAACQAMWEADLASQAMGMELIEIGPGRARLRMRVRADMCNGHKTCHGGTIFTLADSAFAFACNSHNRVTVAQHCSITFLAPTREGDVLTAFAEERHRTARTGLTDVAVTDSGGRVVAIFRGHSVELKGEVVPGLGGPASGARLDPP